MSYREVMGLPVPKAVGVLLLIASPLVTALALRGWVRDLNLPAAIEPDSIAYIESARWFAVGQGLVRGAAGDLRIMTHWPPLYPVALAGGMMLGASAEGTAFAINFWSLGISLFLMGFIVWRMAGAFWAAAAAQAIAALAAAFFVLHLFVLSEPLFVALMCGAVWALVEYQFRRRFVWLAFASVFLALSVMCRYAGLGIVLGVVIYLALSSPRKVRDVLVVGFVTLAPILLWVASRQGDYRWGVDRTIGFAAPSADNAAGGLSVLGSFIAPQDPEATQFWVGLRPLALLGIAALFWRTRLFGCIGLSYIAFIIGSLLFIDRGIPLDGRILLPAGLMVLIVAMTFLARALPLVRDRRFAACAIFLTAYFLVVNLDSRGQQTHFMLRQFALRGFGFEALYPSRSPLMAKLMQLPPDIVPVSGKPYVVRVLVGRAGLNAPSDASWDELRPSRIHDTLRQHRLVFVDTPLLSGLPWRARLRVMKWYFDLEPLASERDGTLYWVKERPENSGTQK